MATEKDKLGDTLHKKERGEEDHFFQEREKGLLEKMRNEKAASAADAARMRCPKDGQALVARVHLGVTIDECPTCQGIWLDRGERETIAQREIDSWIGRLVFAPKR